MPPSAAAAAAAAGLGLLLSLQITRDRPRLIETNALSFCESNYFVSTRAAGVCRGCPGLRGFRGICRLGVTWLDAIVLGRVTLFFSSS